MKKKILKLQQYMVIIKKKNNTLFLFLNFTASLYLFFFFFLFSCAEGDLKHIFFQTISLLRCDVFFTKYFKENTHKITKGSKNTCNNMFYRF